MNFRQHVGLLQMQLAKSSLLTLAVTIAMAGLTAGYLLGRDEFDNTEIAVAVLGTVAIVIFLKVTIMFSIYRILHELPFEGSFLVIAFLVSLLLVLALGAVSYLAYSRVTGFPTSELPMLLAVVYVVVSFFLFGMFRFAHWIFAKPD